MTFTESVNKFKEVGLIGSRRYVKSLIKTSRTLDGGIVRTDNGDYHVSKEGVFKVKKLC